MENTRESVQESRPNQYRAEYLSIVNKKGVESVSEENNDDINTSGEGFRATKIGSADDFEKSLTDQHYFAADAKDDKMREQESLMQESAMQDFRLGDVVPGKVNRLEKEGVLVDINYKSEGYIPLGETGFSSTKDIEDYFTPGRKLLLKIIKLETKEGFTILSKKQADYESAINEIEQAFKEKTVIEAKAESTVKGGLIVSVNNYKGFLPMSHLLRNKNDRVESFLGKTLPVVVIDFDKIRKKIIVSNKNAQSSASRNASDNSVLDKLEAGMVVKGKVSSVKSFGVFVDLGGVEGLVHISELSWSRVNNPGDILSVGQDVDVFILGVDKEGKKVSLGYKQLFQDPWANVDDLYKAGEVVFGKVSRIVDFGAFIELEKGLEGLVHISEISEKRVNKVSDELKVGDPVKVKILRIIPDQQKIGLSIKAVAEDEDMREYAQTQAEESSVTIGDIVGSKEKKQPVVEDDLIEEVISKASMKDETAIDLDSIMKL